MPKIIRYAVIMLVSCGAWLAPQEPTQILTGALGLTEAVAAMRMKPAFKKAATPKPRLKQIFRAKAGQKHAAHSSRVAKPGFRLAQKGKLGNVFRAHAGAVKSLYKQKLPQGLRLRIQSPAKLKSNSITLGHYPKYVQQASKNGTRHFSVPAKIWKKMNSVQQWRANKKFLNRAIQHGDKIHLTTRMKALSGAFFNKARPNSMYAREVAYLISKGYKMSSNGKQMLPPSGRSTGPFKHGSNITRLIKLNLQFKKALASIRD